MPTEPRRVVAAFDDAEEADRAKERLEAQGLDHDEVEKSASADADVAFAAVDDRGDSAERPPATTVAVEVPPSDSTDPPTDTSPESPPEVDALREADAIAVKPATEDVEPATQDEPDEA